MLAAAPQKAPPPRPVLLPGESLALAGPDMEVYAYGDARVEGAMGALSQLLWVKLEGAAWESGVLSFKCAGAMGPYRCALPKGHGRVDLSRALREGCSLAFMGWARMSAQRWMDDYGDGAARARLLDVFQPFLGRRLPDAEGVPELGPEWFGEGDLLRTSPEALLRWLADPAQEEAVRQYRRLLLSFMDETFRDNAWWFETVATPGAGDASQKQAWAVGGNGLVLAVLRLPPGSTREEALARFKAVMVGPPRKK
ncbi:hypothetical protein METEAL_25110 [Mesoterricola silvestris]|uniref:Uncharacterized protein n=2 Tax=Mesoterricola silvestris TaxID=2927979 RepID=A0AA48GSS3_9BACT|nr:hypothetical protein METEAL_25110 [Mesoterricola silvestris]